MCLRRLIPAHAGKTDGWTWNVSRIAAHPRSRGENAAPDGIVDPDAGSSPLTRGKQARSSPSRQRRGLIPAHAGKTGGCGPRATPPGAHPRSRGENGYAAPLRSALPGSSPLTRGKPDGALHVWKPRGLIPAHAGKTTSIVPRGTTVRAHPRSRGENLVQFAEQAVNAGSSPLTRGKQHLRPHRGPRDGLIPAHAGKTDVRRLGARRRRAHPRSRGENTAHHPRTSSCAGSSPLTRGKRGR